MKINFGRVENIVGKVENFLFFPQYFMLDQGHKSSFKLHLNFPLQMLLNWTSQTFCCLVKSERQDPLFKLHFTCYLQEILLRLDFFFFIWQNVKIWCMSCLFHFLVSPMGPMWLSGMVFDS